MSRGKYGVALTEALHEAVMGHLIRTDGQEDICFALWRPSSGATRQTALIQSLILPREGDRLLHGNVSFTPQFFERALAEAAAAGLGLAMLHSHPEGTGWQDMSEPDRFAESTNAGAVLGATDRPFLGMTLGGRDDAWSARFWERVAPRTYEAKWCSCVRVVGEMLSPTFMPTLAPPPALNSATVRTISAWGPVTHANLVRLRVGIIGVGSTGGLVAEALARTGFEDLLLIDFDHIEIHNLDRLVYATSADVGKLKVSTLAQRLRQDATNPKFDVETMARGVFEPDAFRAALDCDVLVSCVDRPWGRHVLNHIAYAHLIPVVDAGILVRTHRRGHLVGADWSAQTVGVGRPCLECLGQYDSGTVQLERDGMLDDPSYIEGLSDDHPLKARQNVFAFSMACASLQVLQLLNLVVAPLGRANAGVQRYHFVGSEMEPRRFGTCHANCLMPGLVGMGDDSPYQVTGARTAAPGVPSLPTEDTPAINRGRPMVGLIGKVVNWFRRR